jgi:hypothetical protein
LLYEFATHAAIENNQEAMRELRRIASPPLRPIG